MSHKPTFRSALWSLVFALTPACAGVQSTMSPAGPAASRIASLGWVVLLFFTAVSGAMWLLIFWTAARRRGSLETHLPWNAPEGRGWLIAGGLVIPAVAFATTFVFTLRTMTQFPMAEHLTGTPAAIRIVGHQWWWEVEYLDARTDHRVVTANEIHIPAGRQVDFELTSYDVIHSFWVPRLHGKVDLNPGMVTRIRVEADAPGVFSGQCSEYCGPQHAHMALIVVAQEPRDFDEWLDRLRASEPDPVDASAQHGQHVFMTHECVLCHTIRGTAAQGLVGPDLTHFADRLGLASNSWPNNRGPLSAWVTDAQALKPHSQMPTITALSGSERQALVQYLESLK